MKKRNNLAIASLLVVVLVATVSIMSHHLEYPRLRFPEPGSESAEPSFKVSIKDGELKKEYILNVYKVEKTDIKKLESMLFDKFPMKDKFKKIDEQLYYADDKISVSIDQSNGYWTYTNKIIESELFNEPVVSKMSDEKCKTIAMRVAREYGANIEQLQDVVVTPIVCEPADGKDFVIGHNIYLKSKIDNKTVYGVSRFCVEVDSKGNIGSIISSYKNIVPFKKEPLINVDEAIEQLENKQGFIMGDQDIVSATINDFEFSYYDDPSSFSEQPYIQPVITLKGVGKREDGTITEFTSIVQALK